MGLPFATQPKTRKSELAGVTVFYRVPYVAVDVLTWDVWIAALDARDYVSEACSWIAEHIIATGSASNVLTFEGALVWLTSVVEKDGQLDKESLSEVVRFGHEVSQSARLPDAVTEEIQTLWDRQLGTEKVSDVVVCDCPEHSKTPTTSTCKFEGLSGVAIKVAGDAFGLKGADLSAPYWTLQLASILARAEARTFRKKAQEKAEQKQSSETLSKYGLIQ